MAIDKTADTNSFIADVLERKGIKTSAADGNKRIINAATTHGNNGTRLLELYGAKLIEPTSFEPDPATCRNEYYYNANTNRLYKKVISRLNNGVTTAHWEGVSDYA